MLLLRTADDERRSAVGEGEVDSKRARKELTGNGSGLDCSCSWSGEGSSTHSGHGPEELQ